MTRSEDLQSENDCRFTFDFREVYWNSRLHHEHERLIDKFQPEDVVADVFAGVGPFAIPAAKKGCGVLANDLNPSSYKYLVQNISDNRVRRDAARDLLSSNLLRRSGRWCIPSAKMAASLSAAHSTERGTTLWHPFPSASFGARR